MHRLSVLLLLLVTCAAQTKTPAKTNTSVPEPCGRYQLFISPGNAADTFLLDTATGRMWRRIKAVDLEDDPIIWAEENVMRSPIDYVALEKVHKRKQKPAINATSQ